MKLVFLSAEFYKDYADCSEIEQKPTRPYIRIGVLINGVLWAVPFRSNIRHEHVIWTNEAKRCGMDFSKAVVIVDPERYIDSAVPHLRGEEFAVLKSTFRKIRSDQVKIDKSTAKGLEWPRLWNFLWGDKGAVEKILWAGYAAGILFLGKGVGMLVGKGGI